MSHSSNDTEFLPGDDDMKSLFDRTTPVGPPTDVDALMSGHSTANVAGHRTGFASGESLFRVTTLASLASVLALLVFGLLMLWPDSSVAFGAVKQAVDGVKTVQYTMIDTMKMVAQAKEQPEFIVIQDDEGKPGLREFTKDGPRKPSKKHQFPKYTKVMILGKHLKRGEPLDGNGSFSLQDMLSGRSIDVNPKKKTFTVMTKQLVLNGDTGEFVEDRKIEPKPRPEIDFYKDIKEIPEEAMQSVGEALVDGRLARGFKRVEKKSLETTTRVYWVDAKTNLPVRIELSRRSLHPRVKDVDRVLTDFVFDEPLDPALFPTEAPEGYREREGGFTALIIEHDTKNAKDTEAAKE